MAVGGGAEVIVVGAGLAGLAAALALSGAGARVTVLERKPYVGGRAYSYLHPALDEVVDSQHVLLGCCTNLIDLCRLSGAEEAIRWYDEITFLEPAREGRTVRRSVIGPGLLPAPGHAGMSFLRAPMLTLRDKAGIARGLIEFMRGYPHDDVESFADWVRKTGQTERAVRHFWEPVVVGALNDEFERCSTKYAGQVFHESFLRSAGGGRLGIPAEPLSEFYGRVAGEAERQGAQLRLRASVERLEQGGAGWRCVLGDGTVVDAAKLVLALPFEQTAKLAGTLPEGAGLREEMLGRPGHFVHAPITTVHLWFDREVTELEHAALLDARIQWMFHKSKIRGWGTERGSYLELTISASFQELEMGREAILKESLREAERFFPGMKGARLVRSAVLKEARATFSVTPGLDRFRPAQETGLPGLLLAGDWTRTEWPSTMEGAVRSGRLAAGAVVGQRERFLSADLEAGGLMRWLV